MPLLLYGVTESDGAFVDLPGGVAGVTVQRVQIACLTCFFSEHSTLATSNTRETALEFHRVVNTLFKTRDIIPFRFPTLLSDRAEMVAEIEKHAAEYHEGLDKVHGRVQIEIRIHRLGANEQHEPGDSTSSGAEYLRARHRRYMQLKSAAEALRAAGGETIERWREREYSDHLRCFALIARGSMADVHAALAAAIIDSELLAHVSGPWPPTQFLTEE